MSGDFMEAMGRALAATRARRPGEATRIIQAALTGEPAPRPAPPRAAPRGCGSTRRRRSWSLCAGRSDRGGGSARCCARCARGAHLVPAGRGGPSAGAGGAGGGGLPGAELRLGRGCAGLSALRALAEGRTAARAGGDAARLPAEPGRFRDRDGDERAGRDASAAGGLSRADGGAQPARMLELVPARGPAAGAGEPAILAGLARELGAEYGIDEGRVFVAGLSAGGAMAAVLGESYPDVFAAIGVHSGLPAGAANDVVSALAAMRGEGGRGDAGPRSRRSAADGPRVIVFHGTADATVRPVNGERIVEGLAGGREKRSSAGGRSFSRRIFRGGRAELWMIEGTGHAWSGGKAPGSYADPAGPDASAEMVRFFLA